MAKKNSLKKADLTFGDLHHLAQPGLPAHFVPLAHDGRRPLDEPGTASSTRVGHGVTGRIVGPARRRLLGYHIRRGRALISNIGGLNSQGACVGIGSRPSVTGCVGPAVGVIRPALRFSGWKLWGYGGSSSLFGTKSDRWHINGPGLLFPPDWVARLWSELPERRTFGYALRPGSTADGFRRGEQLLGARTSQSDLRVWGRNPLQANIRKDCGFPSGSIHGSTCVIGGQCVGAAPGRQDPPSDPDLSGDSNRSKRRIGKFGLGVGRSHTTADFLGPFGGYQLSQFGRPGGQTVYAAAERPVRLSAGGANLRLRTTADVEAGAPKSDQTLRQGDPTEPAKPQRKAACGLPAVRTGRNGFISLKLSWMKGWWRLAK